MFMFTPGINQPRVASQTGTRDAVSVSQSFMLIARMLFGRRLPESQHFISPTNSWVKGSRRLLFDSNVT